MELEPHMIFVDNLPNCVSKRALFYVFGFHGNVVDAFISRNQRGGATRVIDKLNGVRWEGKVIIVKEARFKRGETDRGKNVRKDDEKAFGKRRVLTRNNGIFIGGVVSGGDLHRPTSTIEDSKLKRTTTSTLTGVFGSYGRREP
ncbi:hypothetical protein PIB30_001384 [Stylosanthes scabra]|uniref:RRM domain-containing protein n=1 Tax=Stylosanthes scabra TaxID=79078 RepID=A0ABU6Z3I3_9FABA|nr:hypothetical protein [Stylosanthes scabra]